MHKSCGTYSGWAIHVRNNSQICEPCRVAVNAYQRQRRDKTIKELGYDPRRLKRHGLSKDKYEELLGEYGGKCWICNDQEGSVIDHDHSCCSGKYSCGNCIRGILCGNCNTALGLLKENSKTIERLRLYLHN